ncbi:MAG: hypothetical protein WCD21_45020 [Streptomyces sp.]
MTPDTRPTAVSALEFTVPGLTCGLLPAARPHPRHAEVTQQVKNWAREHLIWLLPDPDDVERYLARDTIEHDTWFFPLADDDRMLDLAIFNLLAFLIDDIADEPGTVSAAPSAVDVATMAAVMAHLVRSDDPPGPGASVLEDLQARLQRIKADMPPTLRERFVTTACDYIELQGTTPQEQGWNPAMSLEESMRCHHRAVGVPVALASIEYRMGVDLTDHLAAHPELVALNDITVRHLLLVNDLATYRKEYFHGALAWNALAVRQTTCHLPLQKAVDQHCAEIIDAERHYVAQRDLLLTGDLGRSPAIRHYLAALDYYLAGNLHWSTTAGRYHGPGHHHDGHGTWRLLPDRTEFSPSP